MTAIRICVYACDGEDGTCSEDTPPCRTFGESAKLAKKDGWFITPILQLCPRHRT